MEIIILLFKILINSFLFTLTKKVTTKININISEKKLLKTRLIGNIIIISSTKNVIFLKSKIFIFVLFFLISI